MRSDMGKSKYEVTGKLHMMDVSLDPMVGEVDVTVTLKADGIGEIYEGWPREWSTVRVTVEEV